MSQHGRDHNQITCIVRNLEVMTMVKWDILFAKDEIRVHLFSVACTESTFAIPKTVEES